MRLLLAFALVALARADEYLTFEELSIVSSIPTTLLVSTNMPSSQQTDVPSETSSSSDSPTETSAAVSTIAPTPEPMNMNTVVMPNDVTVQDAKHIYQEALALQNHVNQLKTQMENLLQSVDATKSPLITNLKALESNATIMHGQLTNLTNQLNDITTQMNTTQATYANVSRIYACFWDTCAPPTTTTLAPTTTAYNCNQNLDATNSSSYFTLPTSSDISCSQQIHSSDNGYLRISMNATIEGDAWIVLSDLITASVIDNITESGPYLFNQSYVSVSINEFAGANDTVGYTMEYFTVDPCEGFCDVSAICGLSAGQPYCFCEPCNTMGSDGKCTPILDNCTTANINRCEKQGKTCKINKDDGTCSTTCV